MSFLKSLFSGLALAILLLVPSDSAWSKAQSTPKVAPTLPAAAPKAKPDVAAEAPPKDVAESAAEMKEPGKKWEVRTSPIAMLIRWYTAEGAIHFNDHWALGPTFTLYAGSRHPFLVGFRGAAVGFFTTYYVEPLPASGWYLALRLQRQKYTSYPVSENATQAIKHIKGSTAELLGGYRAQMANNFFVLAGAGLQRQRYEIIEENLLRFSTDPNRTRVFPYLEAKLGLDF